MVLSYSRWQECPDTGRSTGAYIVVYQGGTIDHFTYISGAFSQSSCEGGYNASLNAVMALLNLRVLNNQLFNKNPGVVPEQAPLIILDRKLSIFMANNGKYNKHTIHVTIGITF